MNAGTMTVCLMIIAGTAVADTDWSSCSSDLRRVQRATRDTADAADGLQSKKQEVDSRSMLSMRQGSVRTDVGSTQTLTMLTRTTARP